MKTYEIEDDIVTYDDDAHTYFVNGQQVISVTQLIALVMPPMYKNVDPDILKKAAQRGTELHDAIEKYERDGEVSDIIELRNYRHLKRYHQIEVVEQEKVVIIRDHGIPVCAGRFDMTVKSPHQQGLGIVDVKRSSHLFIDHVTLQLNLYKLGYEQTYKTPIHYLKVMHLRNHHHEYKDIPVDKKLVRKVLDQYWELSNKG